MNKIKPAKVNRDSLGFWVHPDFPFPNEVIKAQEILAFQKSEKLMITTLLMQDDPLVDEVAETKWASEFDCSDWKPKFEPESFLLSIHDTEDGPCAFFGTPIHNHSDKSKHENTQAMKSVVDEMEFQDNKWGADRNQHNFTWQTILTEEVGELAEASLHAEFGGEKAQNIRNEAVQVAAVALQWVEQMDRFSESHK